MSDEAPILPQRGWRMYASAAIAAMGVLALMLLFGWMLVAPGRELDDLDKRSDVVRAELRSEFGRELRTPIAKDHDSVLAPNDAERGWPTIRFHAIHLGTALLMTARADIDGDAGIDDWQISSVDPVPLHVYDDPRNLWGDSTLIDVLGMSTDYGAINPDLDAATRIKLPMMISAYRHARQARVVLEDLGQAERAYHRATNNWIAFDTLTPPVWRALGQSTSGALVHAVRAVAEGTSLRFTATGNLDDDPCIDEWTMLAGELSPTHVRNDVALEICPAP